jgi:hypothetical protein
MFPSGRKKNDLVATKILSKKQKGFHNPTLDQPCGH